MSDLQTLVAQEVKRQVASLLTADATVKKVLNYLKSTGGGGHSLGDTWISFDSSIPAGGVPFCGQLVTRAMYADLFAWAQEQGKVKTESEWQQIATASGGNCPYYSDGDGSTNFRMPAVLAYLKGATSASEGGAYTAEGLPNVEAIGTGYWRSTSNSDPQSGAAYTLYSHGTLAGSGGNAEPCRTACFDASLSNSIYGGSEHVTPETFTVLVGVYAGSYTNAGDIDVVGLQTAVAALETEVNVKLDSSVPHVIDKGESGEIGWRLWSDGLIEQWLIQLTDNFKENTLDKSFTFAKPYSNNQYVLIGVGFQITNTAAQDVEKTATGFTTSSVAQHFGTGGWYAFGY